MLELITDGKEELAGGFTDNEIRVLAHVNRPRYVKLINDLVMKNLPFGNIVVDGYNDEGMMVYHFKTEVSS